MQWRVAKNPENILGFENWTKKMSIFENRKKVLEKNLIFHLLQKVVSLFFTIFMDLLLNVVALSSHEIYYIFHI